MCLTLLVNKNVNNENSYMPWTEKQVNKKLKIILENLSHIHNRSSSWLGKQRCEQLLIEGYLHWDPTRVDFKIKSWNQKLLEKKLHKP